MVPVILAMVAAARPAAGQVIADLDPATEFNPPPVLLRSPEQIRDLARRVEAEPKAASAFARLRATADSALAGEPDPPPVIVYEGRVGHDPARLQTIRQLQDLRRLRALAWAWALTGRDDYHRGARRYLTAWLRSIEPTGNPINDSRLTDLVQAFQLLRPALDSRERGEGERFLRLLGEREMASDTANNVGNWHARRMTLVALAGALLRDPAFTDYARREAREYVASSFRADGTSHDLERRDALHYHVSGITPMLEIALLLRDSGEDLYRYRPPGGGSVQGSLEYVLPFARGERVHPEWVNTRVALDRRRWESGDPFYRPGKPWDPRESVEMLVLASLFDPALGPLAARLRGDTEPEWEQVVLDGVS